MRTPNTMMSLLLLSAVFIPPASANWFSNPRAGTNLNIGSAPNPTPADLRAIGDAKFAAATEAHSAPAQVAYIQPTQVAYVQTTQVAYVPTMNTAQLTRLEGRPVSGAHGERLGYILAVDQGARSVELQTPKGIAVAMPASLLMEKHGRLTAPLTSRGDVMTMAKMQTGRTVAINIDRRDHATR